MTKKHFILTYEAVPDILARRAPFREEHLSMLKSLEASGHLVLAGAVSGEPAGSVIVFVAETDEVARSFAENDPYVTNGLIERWSIREWTTVVGAGAIAPV